MRFVTEVGAARPAARVAFALNRRQASAVVRNRIRRRLRAALVELDRRGDGLPRGAYLFSADVEARAMPFEQLVDSLGRAVSRASAAPEPSRG